MRRSVLLISSMAGVFLAGSACSAPSEANSQAAASDISQNNDAGAKPVPVVPENAPVTNIKNVPATTGKANRQETAPPFKIDTIGQFDAPFAMAFLPNGQLLVTEKGGTLELRNSDGKVQKVAGVPAVATGGQGGLLDVAVAPDFATSGTIYLSYSEAGEGGSQLALARATLGGHGAGCTPPNCPQPAGMEQRLDGLTVIWRSGETGPGGQFGANILFAPDGKSLYLSSGERQRFTPAQDPNQALGKIVHLTLDGKPAPGNPMAAKGGVQAMTWTSGHRNPYGMVIAPDGRFWEVEMGPRGGDELNLIQGGKNYGWPLVSNGDNYSGQPIPDHPSRPDFAAPVLWWNPSISPGGMIQYSGKMFPQYDGNLFVGALSGKALIRIVLNGDTATAADQWDMGTRIRDLAQAPDGSIWALEDGGKGSGGRLLRLTPKS